MIPLTLAEIAALTGGSLAPAEAAARTVTGPVIIDSRRVTDGALFAALPGERADGHDYAPAAVAAGAAGVLAARLPTAMLFVRNPTGVSHAPAESASDDDCRAGAEALAAVLAALAGA